MLQNAQNEWNKFWNAGFLGKTWRALVLAVVLAVITSDRYPIY